MDSSLKVDQGNLTFDHITCCFQLHFLRQRRYVRQIRIFPVFQVNKVNKISLSQQNRSKIITIIFSEGNGRLPMPNLVLKTIRMIKKVYGAEICVFMAPLGGATSGLSLLRNFCPFLAVFVNQRTFFFIL